MGFITTEYLLVMEYGVPDSYRGGGPAKKTANQCRCFFNCRFCILYIKLSITYSISKIKLTIQNFKYRILYSRSDEGPPRN